MNTKICAQCGEEKPISSFRPYYGGRKGTYSFCKDCEKIMTREKYLMSKGDRMTIQECDELERIRKLYELRRSAGLKAPRHRNETKHGGATALIDEMLAKMEAKCNSEDV